MVFAVEKGLIFTKYWCFKELARRYPSTLLTLSWRRPLSYRNQSVNLLCKLMDWFLYDNGLRHGRVNNAIPNDEHWCFRFMEVSWVLRWWWWFIFFFIRGSIYFIRYITHLIYIWGSNFCVAQMRSFIWTCLNNNINLYTFHSAFLLC